MRDRPLAFIRELGFLPLNSRDDFMVLKKFFRKEEFVDPFFDQELELTQITLPDIQAEEIRELYQKGVKDYDLRRAVMFLKLIRSSYASHGKSFACQPFSIRSLFELIWGFSIRMDNAVIEHQDFETLILHYDRPDSFFYCDPPYYTSEYVYDCIFAWEDHVRLHKVLEQVKGQWLVSYNDCAEIRKLYEGYPLFDFTRIHTMAQRYEAGKTFPELLIGNYDLYERERQRPRQMSLFQDYTDYEKILKEGIINRKREG